MTLFSSAEIGMSHCGLPGMLRKVPSTFPMERKKFSIVEIFGNCLSILASMPKGGNAFVGRAFAGCFYQLYLDPVTQSPVGGTWRGRSGCDSQGTHRFCIKRRGGESTEGQGWEERPAVSTPRTWFMPLKNTFSSGLGECSPHNSPGEGRNSSYGN